MSKPYFTAGVFGVACQIDATGTLRIKVNVRTDQERQRVLAGLLTDDKITIIDLPGGRVEEADCANQRSDALVVALRREVAQETGGCTFETLGTFSYPLLTISNSADPTKPVGDMAFWMPIRLHGTPRRTNEAADHPWISLKELESQAEYRCPGRLGLDGRTGQMLLAAFKWFKNRTHVPEYFSV